MTTTSQDCEALHLALDADPADQDTRRVLADWYDMEAGDSVMADGLREIAASSRVPIRREAEFALFRALKEVRS